MVASESPDLLGGRALVCDDGSLRGTLGSSEWDRALAEAVLQTRETDPARKTLRLALPGAKPGEAHVEFHTPVPDLVIVGAGHIAGPLSEIARILGYRVIVLDDRPEFATAERFPGADEVHTIDFDDPFSGVVLNRLSHVVLVTRGHRYDYECLIRLLAMDVQPFYIGMIGSRRRVRATHEQLKSDGFTPDQMRRVRAPVGLDLGGQTPAEIAVSVLAEMTMMTHGGTGAPLTTKERVVERFFE